MNACVSLFSATTLLLTEVMLSSKPFNICNTLRINIWKECRPYKTRRIRHNYGPGLLNDSLQDYRRVSHLGICIVQNSDLNGKEIYLIILLHFSKTVLSQ